MKNSCISPMEATSIWNRWRTDVRIRKLWEHPKSMTLNWTEKTYEGMAYLMNRGSISPPSPQYYDKILQGYRENGLDESYLETALKNSIYNERFMEEIDEDYDFDDDLQIKF